MNTEELDRYFISVLYPEQTARIDRSMNGFQVAGPVKEVKKVAFAVDACMETFRKAAEAEADVLFVHHGLFWGFPVPVTGGHYKRLEFLIRNNLYLYASHLPLDMNMEAGNNIGIAKHLGLVNIHPFGEYKGLQIGTAGEFESPRTLKEILGILGITEDSTLGVLPFGKERVKTVAMISGGGPREVSEALDSSIDLYITGDASHEVYHVCLEGGINMISAGHYFTETFGPRLLSEKFESETGIEALFIDVPTGL